MGRDFYPPHGMLFLLLQFARTDNVEMFIPISIPMLDTKDFKSILIPYILGLSRTGVQMVSMHFLQFVVLLACLWLSFIHCIAGGNTCKKKTWEKLYLALKDSYNSSYYMPEEVQLKCMNYVAHSSILDTIDQKTISQQI